MTNETFSSAYGVLQRNAETLRTQREPDLDNLLELVTQSVAAYKVCKSRIDAVEQALEQALNGAGLADAETGAPTPASHPPTRSAPKSQAGKTTPSGFDDESDDIPF